METIGYIALIFVGIILGITGGGGSMLAMPILLYLFHLDVVTATAYSLFIIGSASMLGAFIKYRKGLIKFQTGFIIGLPSLLSTFIIRKWFIFNIPDSIYITDYLHVSKRFALMSLFIITVITSSLYILKDKSSIVNNKEKRFHLLKLASLSIIVGMITGLVGIGGGILFIPMLILVGKLEPQEATSTSLFIVLLNALAGFTGDVINQTIVWSIVLPMATWASIGTIASTWLASSLNNISLRKILGWATLVMGCGVLCKEVSLWLTE